MAVCFVQWSCTTRKLKECVKELPYPCLKKNYVVDIVLTNWLNTSMNVVVTKGTCSAALPVDWLCVAADTDWKHVVIIVVGCSLAAFGLFAAIVYMSCCYLRRRKQVSVPGLYCTKLTAAVAECSVSSFTTPHLPCLPPWVIVLCLKHSDWLNIGNVAW